MFEEHKYEELKKLGTELHIPIFETFLRLEVFGKDGNLTKEYNQRGHSWVRNAYNILFCQMAAKIPRDDTFAAGKLSLRDTGGTVQYSAIYPINYSYSSNIDLAATDHGFIADSGDDSSGIVIGIGTNAESFEDYVLQTPVTNGTTSGKISYIAQSTHSITYTAGTKVLKSDFVRYFNNNSGGSIVVSEVGLVTDISIYSVSYNILVSRDLLGATVTVADTGQLKVTYTIQITYPS